MVYSINKRSKAEQNRKVSALSQQRLSQRDYNAEQWEERKAAQRMRDSLKIKPVRKNFTPSVKARSGVVGGKSKPVPVTRPAEKRVVSKTRIERTTSSPAPVPESSSDDDAASMMLLGMAVGSLADSALASASAGDWNNDSSSSFSSSDSSSD